MEVSGGAERGKKEQRIIGFFCPITRHCSPFLSRLSLGSPDQKEIYRGEEKRLCLPHKDQHRQTEGHLRGKERGKGERVDLIFQSTCNTKGGKINKGPKRSNQERLSFEVIDQQSCSRGYIGSARLHIISLLVLPAKLVSSR